jgi:vacuolar-type H+-ATPase subunit C/Vma6
MNAYVYAKACGMLAKSFVGVRLGALFDADSLDVLWTRVTKKEKPLLPELLLTKALQTEAAAAFVGDYTKLLGAYEKPPRVLIQLLQAYEYSNLKDIAAALCNGERNCPPITNCAPFNLLQYDAWPDLAAMTRGSPLAWYNRVPAASEQHNLDERLDKQYTRELWESVAALPREARELTEGLIRMQIAFNNILWAVRLKTYFAMTREDIIARLAFSTPQVHREDPLAGGALEILDWPIDQWSAWQHWKYREMVNPGSEGAPWRLDPRFLSKAFNVALQKEALRTFHRNPCQECSLVPWFIIKRFEVSCIRTAAERLRLNADRDAVAEYLGV